MSLIEIVLAAAMQASPLATPPAATDVQITEPRNAAAGFAVVMWMSHVDTIGSHCSKLPGKTAATSADALAAWQQRNSPYVNAALKYMARIEDMLGATHGEAARQQFRDDRKREFVSATHQAQSVWFPDAMVTDAGCLKLAAALDSGELDLRRQAEFFPILQQLKSEDEQPRPAR